MNATLPRALEVVTEAMSLYQPLAEQLPRMFGRRLFVAYHALSDVLGGLGRTDEAAHLRRQLDQTDGSEPAKG
ncbi:hypothetical protein [Micromonospora sp. NPDC005305]|uniref:hypothetical protein n=1 Tax=Micromonospora sp. NPDC005305 TaxID=3156875 RepID=UPI0033A360D9